MLHAGDGGNDTTSKWCVPWIVVIKYHLYDVEGQPAYYLCPADTTTVSQRFMIYYWFPIAIARCYCIETARALCLKWSATVPWITIGVGARKDAKRGTFFNLFFLHDCLRSLQALGGCHCRNNDYFVTLCIARFWFCTFEQVLWSSLNLRDC